MPRKNRRAPEPEARHVDPRGDAPPWAQAPGFCVHHVGADKPYRCPGCEHVIRPGMWHLAVVPDDAPDERRHWHTGCWRMELRRTRRDWKR